MTVLIDYDAGNIKSVEKAFNFLGEETLLSGNPKDILSADRVVLPGVGSIGPAMEKLKKSGLIPVIHDIIEKNIPFLGICLGFQMLFSGSEESGGVEGLGIFPGKVKLFSDSYGLKIPQIGWNSLHGIEGKKLFKGIDEGSFVYFVHSYYAICENEDIVAARAEYGCTFDCAIESGNACGCQFHPEKSSTVGLNILRNFLNYAH